MIGALLALAARAGAAGIVDEEAADPEDAAGSAPAGAGGLDPEGAEEIASGEADALDDRERLASEDRDPGEIDDPEAATHAAGPSAAGRLELGFANEAGLAGAFDLIEPEPPPPRPWRWGHLDLTVAWRGTYDDEAKGSSRRDELWLLVIWRQ